MHHGAPPEPRYRKQESCRTMVVGRPNTGRCVEIIVGGVEKIPQCVHFSAEDTPSER